MPSRRTLLLAGIPLALVVAAGVLYAWGPTWAGLALLDPEPLSVPDTAERQALPDSTVQDLKAGREVGLTAAQINGLVDVEASLDVDAFHLQLEGPVATLDTALYLHPMAQRWANVHAVVEGEVVDGRFTQLKVHVLDLSGRDLAAWLGPDDLSEAANARVHWVPDLQQVLAEVQHASIEEGQVRVKLKQGGYERL